MVHHCQRPDDRIENYHYTRMVCSVEVPTHHTPIPPDSLNCYWTKRLAESSTQCSLISAPEMTVTSVLRTLSTPSMSLFSQGRPRARGERNSLVPTAPLVSWEKRVIRLTDSSLNLAEMWPLANRRRLDGQTTRYSSASTP